MTLDDLLLGSLMTAQDVADALKLAPSAGEPAAGSAMDRLDAKLSAVPTADEIADAVLARSVSNVENTAPQASLTTLVLAAVNKANTEDNAGYLTVYRTDGATEHVRIPISVDPTAVPIDGVG
jgi:hypothetical protein